MRWRFAPLAQEEALKNTQQAKTIKIIIIIFKPKVSQGISVEKNLNLKLLVPEI